MIKDVIEFSANSLWPQIGLVILFACFIGIVIWTFTGKKQRFERERLLPLDDGEAEEEQKT
jgi:cbb3-type cytochrome oxidase subunit 3